jgi:phage shock protein C
MAKEGKTKEVKRLYRSRRDRMIAGVCGGLGQHFQMDATIFRVLFLISILFGGIGILIYFISIIIIPENPAEKQLPAKERKASTDTSLLWGTLLLVIGAAFLLDRMDIIPIDYFFSFRYSFRFILPLFLVALGIYLIIRKENGNNKKRVKKLYRSPKNKMIAGVASGMAAYFNMDPAVMRIIWVIGTILTHGIGIIIYFILALVLPKEPEEQAETTS